MKNINQKFQILQAIQVGLLVGQGLLLLTSRKNELSLIIWTLLGLAALLQVVIVLYAPKQIEASQLTVDRSALVRLRILATLPYALIIMGIIYSR
jgi:hypothetical protein